MFYSKQQVENGVGFFYVIEYLKSLKNLDELILEDVIRTMSPRYTCNRPPGAAGAAILTTEGKLFYGDVRPADGSLTCIDLESCMIEDGHCVRTIHAEVRVILNAAKLGVCTKGATLYSILKPCFQCTKVIIAAGISKIVYAGAAYDETRTKNILENAPQKIEVVKLNVNLNYGQELNNEA
jgi:dCMP deaminase